ncbi:hypothetical protein C6497_10410 [Candidatus Poribacteria bacterium]|nr:MAG: hypothetical protein C6497_10410 [Candidatus Poribacteria bacterium]
MKTTDVDLIHRILDGDDTAFTELVEKYQKPVHALVWRKIGDFHIAEEITQDTFLKAYQELKTLKKPHSFASWLYVIASNKCNTWLRKKRPVSESFENTNTTQFGEPTYSGYVISEKERIAIESQRETVEKLLAKLQESERTVITLYYFGEMSSAEIGAFLGVSANTVRSRLRRAQQRLKKEESMIREALEHFQISPTLTDNIMKEISRLKPTPSSSKPLIPWAVAASTAVLITLTLGIGKQHSSRFQKPYSLEAQSEMSVEITKTPIVQEIMVEPGIRHQYEDKNAVGKNDTSRQNPDEVLLAAAETEGEDSILKKNNMDLEMILAGIKSNDELVKSGEVKVVSKFEITVIPTEDENHLEIRNSTIIFDSDRIRFDSLSKQDSLSRTTFFIAKLNHDHKELPQYQ